MTLVSKFPGGAFALFSAGAVMVAGCASSPPLRTEESTAGIRAAEEVGAADVPRAALHLQLAREALDSARALAKDGESEKASSMLSRAEVDAELAVALSHEDSERSDADAALERVRALRTENR
ncbi:MAG: DUF4398 domain-containing protein [Deltaproteobacteria bacterium]|nr:DUF4398 domain-containing protein [Deltaproteobacteria bacterium]